MHLLTIYIHLLTSWDIQVGLQCPFPQNRTFVDSKNMLKRELSPLKLGEDFCSQPYNLVMGFCIFVQRGSWGVQPTNQKRLDSFWFQDLGHLEEYWQRGNGTFRVFPTWFPRGPAGSRRIGIDWSKEYFPQMSNEKKHGRLGLYRGFYYPVIEGLQ